MERLENPRMRTGGDVALGAKIRRFRVLAEMTQEQMAETLGLSYQIFQRYEAGTVRVSAVRLFDIAAVLEVPVEDFFAPVTRRERETSEVFASKRSVALVRRYNTLSPADQELAFAILGTMAERSETKAEVRKLEVVAA